MNTIINIENYEEIMFRLVEDDFDESTRIDLLRQIESDALFKFEWESWKKTKFVDPLENYTIESNELAEKIILIAEPQTAGRKRFFYYWAVAASILVLISSLFLLTSDFNLKYKPGVATVVSKSQNPAKTVIATVQNNTVTIAVANRKQFRNQRIENTSIPVVTDSNTILPTKNTLAEILKVVDSIPIRSNELAKATEKKPRYSITIETSDISGPDQQNYVMAQREKVKFNKVFTNTKMFLRRKPNGEPDRIILIGDDNSYVCLNLNY
jgi:hypothetical protein